MRLFPTTTIHLCQDRELWYSISLMPHSPSRTIVKCEVYQLVPTVNACGEAFLRDHMYAGTSYGAIQTSESDGWELQTQILEKLRQHCKLERSAGEEIWPAFVGTAMTEDGKETDRLCRELESCATGLEGDVLDW
ncbi:hypothetical protein FN846DRAFT_691 [Sphaerosporella brunnea]|uniref:Uncharacterized protein n=1 Tax=Sphaerosporella brunnea TaxID=1250544 RepID=A0A5J5FB98_9PEZI|nr:hypothetical protein FN846DRAFT_691 [Sphaerosporella brunnea]